MTSSKKLSRQEEILWNLFAKQKGAPNYIVVRRKVFKVGIIPSTLKEMELSSKLFCKQKTDSNQCNRKKWTRTMNTFLFQLKTVKCSQQSPKTNKQNQARYKQACSQIRSQYRFCQGLRASFKIIHYKILIRIMSLQSWAERISMNKARRL